MKNKEACTVGRMHKTADRHWQESYVYFEFSQWGRERYDSAFLVL